MIIFDAGNVSPKQARPLFNVTLGELLFFAECAKAVAYNHPGIIPLRYMEGKKHEVSVQVEAYTDAPPLIPCRPQKLHHF